MAAASMESGAPGTWIVIGLGNPGKEYEATYHNVGFRVVELLAERWRADWSRPGGVGMVPARVAVVPGGLSGPAGTVAVVLVEPWTYMNRSGQVLVPLADRYGDDAGILVVSDDLALPAGRIRIRERGSAGGHNGLKSIASALGSDEYGRVRVGIDVERPDGDTKDFVLSSIARPVRQLLARTELMAANAVEEIVRNGSRSAMDRFNGVDLRDAAGE